MPSTAVMDPEQLNLTGEAVQVISGVRSFLGGGTADFTFSQNGLFAYIAGRLSLPPMTISWLDRNGKVDAVIPKIGAYYNPRLSPDGQRFAFVIGISAGSDVYVYDLARDTMQRLTFNAGANLHPNWAPDGRHLVFDSDRNGGKGNLYWMRADGGGEAVRLTTSNNHQSSPSVSPDGNHIAFAQRGAHSEIWTMPLDLSSPDHPKTGNPEVLLRSDFDETNPSFSPDGRWIAYQSMEVGTQQVFVRPYPGPGGKWQISSTTGITPAWSRSGKELLYRTITNEIMTVSYAADGDTFSAGKPSLWTGQMPNGKIDDFDPAPDGKRQLILNLDQSAEAVGRRVTFLVNFFDELRRKAH